MNQPLPSFLKLPPHARASKARWGAWPRNNNSQLHTQERCLTVVNPRPPGLWLAAARASRAAGCPASASHCGENAHTSFPAALAWRCCRRPEPTRTITLGMEVEAGTVTGGHH